MIDLVLMYRYYQQGKKSHNLAFISFLNIHSRNSLHLAHNSPLGTVNAMFYSDSVSNSVKFSSRIKCLLLCGSSFQKSPQPSQLRTQQYRALGKNELDSLLDALYILQWPCPFPPSDRVIKSVKRYQLATWLDFWRKCKM